MGRYVSREDVISRLQSKVKFDETGADQSKMSYTLLDRLISEAESQVELDLTPRYEVPFKGAADEAFRTLPTLTRDIIRTLAELQSVVRVLETDFGRGTSVDGERYTKPITDRYNSMINDKLLKKKMAKEDDESNQWKYPPLPNLKLAYFNTEADDGYMGIVINTSRGIGSYPIEQINSPGENWWTGVLSDTRDLGER